MLKIKLGVVILLSILTLSCSRNIGYGVIKISQDEAKLKSGSLIKIINESRIRETWVYNTESEKFVEIEKWRVKYFKKLDEAVEYQKGLQTWDGYFAVVKRPKGHSMRIQPIFDPPAMEVYRLKNNQKVKVIGRTDEKMDIGRFSGYWWKLITEDGVEGWSYDSYLNIYNGEELVKGEKDEEGPEIEKFFKVTWRPDYYLSMINSRNINLDKFKTKFGLFPDFDKKEIIISMPDHYVNQSFTSIIKTGNYNYKLEGSDIQLDFSYKDMVLVSYSQDFNSYFNEFVSLKANIGEVIQSEISKRDLKYNEFKLNGPTYKSRAYGTVKFEEDKKFIWRNMANLKAKQLLTSNAKSSGDVKFDTFLATSLKGKYDGAITFDFGSRQVLTFLYLFEDGGVRFLHVPKSKIKDSLITTDNFFTPTQLFFTGN